MALTSSTLTGRGYWPPLWEACSSVLPPSLERNVSWGPVWISPSAVWTIPTGPVTWSREARSALPSPLHLLRKLQRGHTSASFSPNWTSPKFSVTPHRMVVILLSGWEALGWAVTAMRFPPVGTGPNTSRSGFCQDVATCSWKYIK